MKNILFLFALITVLSVQKTTAQRIVQINEGTQIKTPPNGVWKDINGVELPPEVDRGCAANATGVIRLVNNGNQTVQGSVCFKRVNKKTGDISGEVWQEFQVWSGHSTSFADVYVGTAQCKYTVYSATGETQQVSKTIFVEICKVNDLELRYP
jgi:hypothetical protein